MAAYWRSKREKKILLSLSLCLFLSNFLFVAFCQKRRNERKRSFASIYLTRLLLLKENERTIEKGRERERTIHAHTFRITHGKPCAAIKKGYYTNPVLIFLSKRKKISLLYCAPIRREKEKEREREGERREEKKTGVSVGVRHIEYRYDCIVLNSSHQHDGFLLLTNTHTHIHQVKFFLLFNNNRENKKGEEKEKKSKKKKNE